MRHSYSIELIEDAVFSARAATEGGHESLDRIPGAALLGAAASRLYRQLDRREAWLAFHSGRLRFSDGLPLHGQSPTWPVPLSWHHRKAEAPAEHDRLLAERLFNLQHGKIPRDDDREPQPKQLRAGYVDGAGHWRRPTHGLRLKTAIDRKHGRAAQGQLFGYDALHRGQRFAASLEADDDFDPALFERVRDALDGELLLGRSRSAEYGRSRLSALDFAPPAPGPAMGETLTLWLLADLALVDTEGQPTLNVDAATLGLPEGSEICWDQTFLRSRRYSPWNAARHGFDRERLVLSAGGVITARLPAPPDAALLARLHRGIGLHREAGLGRLWANPPLLRDHNPDFGATTQATDSTRTTPTPRPNHPLVAWLEAQDHTWKETAEATALKLADDYRRAVERARRAAGVAADLDFGPSKSQWSRIQEAAQRRSGEDLYHALFEGNNAIVKPKAEGWSIEVPPSDGGQWERLAGWLQSKLPATGQEARAYAHQVRWLARRVQDDISKRRV